MRCDACGLGYLAERPAAEDVSRYYPDDAYYAYRKPVPHSLFEQGTAVSSAWYFLKRSVLAHRYGYRHLGGSGALAAVLDSPFSGSLRRKATFGLDVLLHPFVEDGALLEVGCGSGMYLDLMRALGWKHVVGVDFSEKAVRQARDVLGLDVRLGELQAVGLESQAFDAVSVSHTLEHVADPVAFLGEIRRVMRPGGRLAVVVPNLESLCARRFGACWVGLDPPRHLADFTSRSLATAFARAGLAVESIRTTARTAYDTALFSAARRAGDRRLGMGISRDGFGFRQRVQARTLAAWEKMACAMGRPRGEEIVAVARNSA